MLLYQLIGLFLVGFINLFLGFSIFAKNYKKINYIAFFVFAFSLGLWAIEIALFILVSNKNEAIFISKIFYITALFIGYGSYLFAISFPDNPIKLKVFTSSTLLLFSIIFPIIFFKNFLTKNLIYHSWGKQIVLNKFDYVLYGIVLLLFFTLALILLYKKKNNFHGIYSRQAYLFFIGVIFSFIFGVLFNLILPFFGNYEYIWLGPMFSTLFVISIGYNIRTHKLFDVRGLLLRYLSYLLSIVILSSVYGFIVFLLFSELFHIRLSIFAKIFISVMTGIASIYFNSLQKYFNKVTKNIFFRDTYDADHLYDSLNKTLISSIKIDELLNSLASLLTTTLKIEFAGFYIKLDEDRRIYQNYGLKSISFTKEDLNLIAKYSKFIIYSDDISSDNEDLKNILTKNQIAIIIKLDNSLNKLFKDTGLLYLGYKNSGSSFTYQDLKIINNISNEIVLGIQNSISYDKIANFNTTLQEKIKQSTSQLIKANHRLVEMDNSKDEFVSMASHQLRTPLTSIKGNISLVIEGDAGPINDTQKKLLSQAFTSSQRMVYLISDLLNVSRLKTGKFLIEKSNTNLAKIIEEEINQLIDTAANRHLELSYLKPDNFPDLMLDETKTRQVIMNFIDNAIYYTSPGGHIKVSLEDKEKTVEFKVVDDGIGVPAAVQHNLFTKFYRADNAKKARPDGTGLGLYMSKKVIVAEGGSIIFQSKEGQGSTFGFSFIK